MIASSAVSDERLVDHRILELVVGELVASPSVQLSLNISPETTMDPERRTLLQVRLEDIAECETIFTTLMGEDVEARRKFIEDNALDVKNLVSQLNLIIRNAERHADKPEFREDMMAWTGDVKYHAGALRAIQDGRAMNLEVSMPPNPSHLEFVNPVVEGMARAAGTIVTPQRTQIANSLSTCSAIGDSRSRSMKAPRSAGPLRRSRSSRRCAPSRRIPGGPLRMCKSEALRDTISSSSEREAGPATPTSTIRSACSSNCCKRSPRGGGRLAGLERLPQARRRKS